MESKICTKCSVSKPLSEFHKKKGTKDGHRNECKLCVKKYQEVYRDEEYRKEMKEYDKRRYAENRDECRERSKQFHIDHKEEILAKKKIYRSVESNKNRSREYAKNYRENEKDKYYKYRRNNPHVIAWRSMLYRTLDYFGSIKEQHTIDMLGYSALDLKHHIENQFIEGMSWNNYGEWEIDHIRPLCTFDSDALPSVVNALSNLRPLWE